MTYIAIYGINDATGEVETLGEARNSHGGAAYVWRMLGDRFLGPDDMRYVRSDGMDEVWRLADDARLSESERITMLWTFDGVWVKRDNANRLIEALRKFVAEYGGTSTLSEALAILAASADDESIRGFCCNHTSVNSDTWMSPDRYEGAPESCNAMFSFDLDRADANGVEPWELFEYPAMLKARA